MFWSVHMKFHNIQICCAFIPSTPPILPIREIWLLHLCLIARHMLWFYSALKHFLIISGVSDVMNLIKFILFISLCDSFFELSLTKLRNPHHLSSVWVFPPWGFSLNPLLNRCDGCLDWDWAFSYGKIRSSTPCRWTGRFCGLSQQLQFVLVLCQKHLLPVYIRVAYS